MTNFDHLIQLATEAKHQYEEGLLEFCTATLDKLYDMERKAYNQVMHDMMEATYK